MLNEFTVDILGTSYVINEDTADEAPDILTEEEIAAGSIGFRPKCPRCGQYIAEMVATSEPQKGYKITRSNLFDIYIELSKRCLNCKNLLGR